MTKKLKLTKAANYYIMNIFRDKIILPPSHKNITLVPADQK